MDTPNNQVNLLQRLRQFSWWNLIGISNALAVGFGDFTVVYPCRPMTSSMVLLIPLQSTPPAVTGSRDGRQIIPVTDRYLLSRSPVQVPATPVSGNNPQNIPVFGPFGLLALLLGLFWFGNRRRK
ncbi:MAG: hypothetical protein R3F02_19570 [Thiolinea sp.]